MSKAIAKKATIDEERADNRGRMESAIWTRVAASDAKIKTTRDTLKVGFKATAEQK